MKFYLLFSTVIGISFACQSCTIPKKMRDYCTLRHHDICSKMCSNGYCRSVEYISKSCVCGDNQFFQNPPTGLTPSEYHKLVGQAKIFDMIMNFYDDIEENCSPQRLKDCLRIDCYPKEYKCVFKNHGEANIDELCKCKVIGYN